ncbi:hypothetical protein MHB46_18175 [Paenibacillus sp. FSL H7-0703]|uniref:hypothetical protein n=1 Tax=Paenibacillus sp. FSL H7-0703 TaxID=2921438 RepID=UPI0030F6937F
MKSTTPIYKIKTEFSLDQSTSIGGSKIFLDYLEKIKLSQVLQILLRFLMHVVQCYL